MSMYTDDDGWEPTPEEIQEMNDYLDHICEDSIDSDLLIEDDYIEDEYSDVWMDECRRLGI